MMEVMSNIKANETCKIVKNAFGRYVYSTRVHTSTIYIMWTASWAIKKIMFYKARLNSQLDNYKQGIIKKKLNL
jgi:uncharacterized membrane protein YcfT